MVDFYEMKVGEITTGYDRASGDPYREGGYTNYYQTLSSLLEEAQDKLENGFSLTINCLYFEDDKEEAEGNKQ